MLLRPKDSPGGLSFLYAGQHKENTGFAERGPGGGQEVINLSCSIQEALASGGRIEYTVLKCD